MNDIKTLTNNCSSDVVVTWHLELTYKNFWNLIHHCYALKCCSEETVSTLQPGDLLFRMFIGLTTVDALCCNVNNFKTRTMKHFGTALDSSQWLIKISLTAYVNLVLPYQLNHFDFFWGGGGDSRIKNFIIINAIILCVCILRHRIQIYVAINKTMQKTQCFICEKYRCTGLVKDQQHCSSE